MKICCLANGISIHTHHWVGYFINKGYEVHLISYTPTQIKRVKVHVLRSKVVNRPLLFILRLLEVRNLIKKIKPDIVHAHFVTGYGFLGALAGFHPFVLSVWGSDVLIAPKKSAILKWLIKFALKKADLVICDGENLKEETIRLGTDPQKIKIILHGVDIQKFKPEQRDFHLPVVISIRNLEPSYDVGTLIKSIPLVLKKVPNVKFVVAGEGSEENSLKRSAESLEILDNIKFIGQISHNEILEYLASADVYVSTSLSDGGIAISTLEAMACGLTPVITDVGDNKKWVKDNYNGFIVPVKKPKILAEKIIYLLNNKNIRRKFGKINRKIIEQRANCEKEMLKMEKPYKELLRQKGG